MSLGKEKQWLQWAAIKEMSGILADAAHFFFAFGGFLDNKLLCII
jgi:uncharacterized protein YqcC (DUF446 family)